MKCKVCGRELKGKGNICKNCYNEKQKQKAIAKDKKLIYELNSTYKPGYELLRIIDALIIGAIIIAVCVILYFVSFWISDLLENLQIKEVILSKNKEEGSHFSVFL